MGTLGYAANQFGSIIRANGGNSVKHDIAEMVDKVHQLQAMVLAQAAARAYPDMYRPLGGWPGKVETPERPDPEIETR